MSTSEPADTESAIDATRMARAYLVRVAEPPAPALVTFVAEEGALRAARRVRAGDVPSAVAEETAARRHVDLVARDFARAQAVGARLVTPEDAEWPAWPFTALDIAQARGLRWAGQPLALWVRGTATLADIGDHAVAVVGARAASAYGEQAAAEFGHGLTLHGLPVVSGAADGLYPVDCC